MGKRNGLAPREREPRMAVRPRPTIVGGRVEALAKVPCYYFLAPCDLVLSSITLYLEGTDKVLIDLFINRTKGLEEISRDIELQPGLNRVKSELQISSGSRVSLLTQSDCTLWYGFTLTRSREATLYA